MGPGARPRVQPLDQQRAWHRGQAYGGILGWAQCERYGSPRGFIFPVWEMGPSFGFSRQVVRAKVLAVIISYRTVDVRLKSSFLSRTVKLAL